LRSYDARLIKYSTQLVNQIQRRVGQPIDASTWINYFAFDVMGDLAFGKGFAALEKGESHFFINLIHVSGVYPGLFGSIPWLLHCITKLPIPPSLNAFVQMLKYSEKMVDERKTYKPEEPDVMSHLFAAGDFFDDPATEKLLLTGDARLLIVAGSDTTAATLTYSCYHFAKDKSLVTKLRGELEEHNIRNDENFNVLGLTPLEYLNGFINEVLRLHPPVAGKTCRSPMRSRSTNKFPTGGVYRMTPKDGVTINGHFIPTGTVILTPQYTIHRCKLSNFASHDDRV
jgi:cytochrome P450 family 628